MMAKNENTAKKPYEAPEIKAETETKVYKFVSENKALTCAALGIQFKDGKAETTSVEIAKALSKCSGVTMVED